MEEPVLHAFEVFDNPGKYNVWRYDTPQTQCVLFCYKADSRESAIKAAMEIIENGGEL